MAPAARAWLARPWSRRAGRRIALITMNDVLAWPQVYPLLHYRHRFAASGIEFRLFDYHHVNVADLGNDLAAIAVQAPYDPGDGTIERLLGGLKAAHPETPLSFFDWFSPTDIRFSERVAPYVSHYVKKALLRDRSAYMVPIEGHTQLTDHFSRRLGTENPPADWRIDPSVVERLMIGPAFATSPVLLQGFERPAAPSAHRPIDLHARIAVQGTPWYRAMRQEAADKVTQSLPDLRVVSGGRVSRRAFLNELRASKLCFSPFGYGELCWRDYEAALCGAVIVKPDMSHIECDPDIFVPFETYIPIRWDLADLEERVREALHTPDRLADIAAAARQRVVDYLAGPSLERFVAGLCGR
jgi:hypothetical protein